MSQFSRLPRKQLAKGAVTGNLRVCVAKIKTKAKPSKNWFLWNRNQSCRRKWPKKARVPIFYSNHGPYCVERRIGRRLHDGWIDEWTDGWIHELLLICPWTPKGCGIHFSHIRINSYSFRSAICPSDLRMRGNTPENDEIPWTSTWPSAHHKYLAECWHYCTLISPRKARLMFKISEPDLLLVICWYSNQETHIFLLTEKHDK